MKMEDLTFYASIFDEEIYLINENVIAVAEEEEIVHAETVVDEVFSEDTTDIFFFGDNSSKLTVLVNYPSEEWIIPRDKLFLEKILSSVQLSIDKIALINISKSGYKGISDILKRLPNNNVIAFGLAPSFLEGYEYDKLILNNRLKLVFTTANLMDIAMDKGQKMILWKNMKGMFSL